MAKNAVKKVKSDMETVCRKMGINMTTAFDFYCRKVINEVAFLNSLPDTVTVYRGVTKVNHTRQKALSWTVDYQTAVWFANRNRYRNYETESGIHEVWTVTEGEVIVNLYGEKFEIRREAV